MSRKNSTHATLPRRFSVALSLCGLCVLCVSVVNLGKAEFASETGAHRDVAGHHPHGSLAPSERHIYRDDISIRRSSAGAAYFTTTSEQAGHDISLLRSSQSILAFKFYEYFVPTGLTAGQGPELDYSTFKHTSQRHASLACTDCHKRASNNSATPSFPSHGACMNCHGQQFVTPLVPMCTICHTDVKSTPAPVKNFPANFKESFNVKFDHTQHMSGSARPKNGCVACHASLLNRGAARSIPANIAAHNQCYVCHTPSSTSTSGREIASCGVCHEEKRYARTPTNSRAFRANFYHAKHGPGQRLECTSCHNLTAAAPQSKQVSSPVMAEHFPAGRGLNCASCHNGKRAFGGDLGFKDCKRCHLGQTFRMAS